MRTSIWLEPDAEGGYKCGSDDPRIDVSHEKSLTDEEVEAFRALGRLVAARMEEEVKPGTPDG